MRRAPRFRLQYAPTGNGSRDEPIVVRGDASGVSSDDLPGPVTVRPPNTFDASSGFLLFGKRDVRIEGFVIEGADDSGIQIRPHPSTRIDSTRVSIVGNTILDANRRGIDVRAVGDVTVRGNVLIGNRISGISLRSGIERALRPLVTENSAVGNDIGIAIDGIADGVIVANELAGNVRGLSIIESLGLHIAQNGISESVERAISCHSSENVEFEGNTIQAGSDESEVFVSGILSFAGNRFTNPITAFDLQVHAGSGPTVRFINNLIYANANDGIGMGAGSEFSAAGALVMNNTLYANEDWGVVIGSPGGASPDATRANNILVANGSGGIAADHGSLAGLSIGFNLHDGRYGSGVQPSVTDLHADPQFVAPAGPDRLSFLNSQAASLGAADADDEIAEESKDEVLVHPQAVALEFGDELLSREPVMRWVFEEGAIRPACQRVARHLLEEESSRGL